MTRRFISLSAFATLALYLVSLATSATAQQPSSTRNITLDRPGAKKWALLIGVNKYIHASQLAYCSRDVSVLAERLMSLGFPKQHVYQLHDQAAERKNEPYKSNIDTVLELLLGKLDATGEKLAQAGLVSPGDLVIVAFSGHGVHLDGTSYFCPIDARLDRHESLLSLDRLYKLLELSPANVKLLLVDACRNDPRPGGEKTFKTTASTRQFASSLESPPKGLLVLSSCAAGQLSVEDEQFQHGVFMHFLLDGLAGSADQQSGDRNQRVSLLELYRYASVKTKAHVADTRRILQTPSLKGELVGDFEFGQTSVPLLKAPFSRDEALAAQRGWSSLLKTPVQDTNSLGMKLNLIPAGEFLMGGDQSPEEVARIGGSKAEYFEREHPQHRVRITKPFYLGTYEVTQSEYERVMGQNPSFFSSRGAGKESVSGLTTSRFPVESVSWDDAMEFCRKLSALPAEQSAGRRYRLPTEAEWEYACRAGTSSAFHFGASLNGSDANADGNYPYGTTTKGPYLERTTSVGSYAPNTFGLYDMHGNVLEWCADWYDSDYYAASPLDDPQGPSKASVRVFRGGSWLSNAWYCRSADRRWYSPDYRYDYLGFRVVAVQSAGK